MLHHYKIFGVERSAKGDDYSFGFSAGTSYLLSGLLSHTSMLKNHMVGISRLANLAGSGLSFCKIPPPPPPHGRLTIKHFKASAIPQIFGIHIKEGVIDRAIHESKMDYSSFHVLCTVQNC